MIPRLFLGCGLAFTLTFNMAWAWGTGTLSVIAAGVCTLIVPAGLTLWPLVPAETWLRRGARTVVMTGICAAAAYTSFWHSFSVLLGAGWTDWTAGAVIGGTELLVALSTMALRTPAKAEADSAVQGGGHVTADSADTPVHTDPVLPVQAADTPAEVGADTSTDTAVQPRTERPVQPRRLSAVDDPERAEQFREWVSTLPERPTEYAVRKRFGCRQSVAQRLLAELDEEPEEPEEEAV